MTQTVFELLAGVVTGGLILSAAWGLFWLAISSVGLSRGTCGWPVVLKSCVGGFVPLCLALVVVWWMGGVERATAIFAVGLAGMPMVLLGLWMRRMPDGQRAGTHLSAGVQHLMGQLLGKHQGCGGCDEGHDHGACG